MVKKKVQLKKVGTKKVKGVERQLWMVKGDKNKVKFYRTLSVDRGHDGHRHYVKHKVK